MRRCGAPRELGEVRFQMARRTLVIVFAAITAGLFVFSSLIARTNVAAARARRSQRTAAAVHRSSQDTASKPASRVSYVLALSYMEQLANAVSNFLSLRRVMGRDLSATVVSPFVHDSRLFGLPNYLPDEQGNDTDGETPAKPSSQSTVIPLSVLSSLTKQRYCNVATFGEFLFHSYRDIVLLHPVRRKFFDKGEGLRSKYFTELLERSIRSDLSAKSPPVFTCRKTLANFSLKLEGALNRLPSYGGQFRVVEAICFDGDSTDPLPASTLKQMAKRGNVSYVLTHWEGSACTGPHTENSNNPHCNPSSNRPLIYPSSPTPSSCFSKQIVAYTTPYVEHLAEKYLHSQGLSDASGLVTAHVRIEKLLLSGAVKCCMQELVQVLQTINRRSAGSSSNLLLTTDMGPQGTRSCGRECHALGARIHTFMKKQGLHPNFVNPADIGGPNNSGVAALVDLAALAQGETVVLVGGGQFQSSILLRALNSDSQQGKHRLKAVHSICSPSTRRLLQSEAAQIQKKGIFVTTFTGNECTKTAT